MRYFAIRYQAGDLGRPDANERRIRDAFLLIEPHLRERCEVVCLEEVRDVDPVEQEIEFLRADIGALESMQRSLPADHLFEHASLRSRIEAQRERLSELTELSPTERPPAPDAPETWGPDPFRHKQQTLTEEK